jgi:filamentous hemagglutinin family protein
MKNNGSLNRVYRVVWNAAKAVWQAVCETGKAHGKERSARSLRRAAVVAGLLAFGGAVAAPAVTELPTGGNVVAGGATISSSGSNMVIDQTTQRTAIDWQTFNIGSAAHVHFQQPAGGAALNRVLDTNASQIYGRLTSTGQVFLVNPNGVFFAPGAQVDVGGLVASTLGISNASFMAGNHVFEGSSSNAIINQGNITAAPGGTIALIAAKVTNDGTLTANGGNVLLGAGSKVTLDMGGPVKMQVDQGAVDALVEQGGAIKADGGLVYLTAKAAGDLASTVINHTGVTEAQTLSTGEQGQIYLMGGMDQERIVVGGTLDASAPNGGNGGFIETSASRVDFLTGRNVTTRAVTGETGTWLIDPNDYTIAASGGNITGAQLSSDLGSNNVVISTAVSGTASGNGDIFVNDAVSWSTNRLTLTAERNINVNANLDASGTASLAFEYGQGSTNGAGSRYTVADNAKIYIPQATAFTWKKGSTGAVNNLVFNNGNLRFGNGTQASLNSNGLLEQPWYFDNTSVVGGVTRNAWFKLTFSNYALNMEVGAGGDGSSSWNRNGSLLDSQSNLAGAISNRYFDISGYQEGSGVIVSSVTLAFAGGESVKVDNTYTLSSGASFVKIDTELTNVGAGAANNLRLWVGTQDDYVATRDSQFKFKGNLTGNGFEQIMAQTDQSKALKITEFNTDEGAAILFYSTSNGADTSIASCCSFTNATGINPRTSTIASGQTDGSYALFIRLADLAAGQRDGMTWYYAAAPAAQINAVVTTVAQSAGVATPTPTPTPSTTPTVPQDTAVSLAQNIPVEPLTNTSTVPGLLSPTAPPPTVVTSGQGALPVFDVSGGLAFVQVGAPQGQDGGTATNIGIAADLPPDTGGRDPFGFMRVFVVNGGTKLPDVALGGAGQNNQDERNQ